MHLKTPVQKGSKTGKKIEKIQKNMKKCEFLWFFESTQPSFLAQKRRLQKTSALNPKSYFPLPQVASTVQMRSLQISSAGIDMTSIKEFILAVISIVSIQCKIM